MSDLLTFAGNENGSQDGWNTTTAKRWAATDRLLRIAGEGEDSRRTSIHRARRS
jgi:hypothetical protein